MELNFLTPVQVKFFNIQEFEVDMSLVSGEIEVDLDAYWLGGIGYADAIICGCCGGLIDLDEIQEDFAELKEKYPEILKEINNPIQTLEWVNISEEILG